jgi:FkbM family methyltransferase
VRAPDKKQALAILRRRAIPIETIIDVGVQLQTPELIEAFPDKKHILFEAVAEFGEPVAHNYAKVDHTLVTAAVGDHEGEATLQVRTIMDRFRISHSSVVSGPADSGDKRTVPMITLDGYLARNPQRKPYLVKIDVDGYEMPVMRGAERTFMDTSVVIVEAVKGTLTERIGFLESRGFEIFDLAEPCYYDRSFWQCDVIMLKSTLQAKHFEQLRQNTFNEARYETFVLR